MFSDRKENNTMASYSSVVKKNTNPTKVIIIPGQLVKSLIKKPGQVEQVVLKLDKKLVKRMGSFYTNQLNIKLRSVIAPGAQISLVSFNEHLHGGPHVSSVDGPREGYSIPVMEWLLASRANRSGKEGLLMRNFFK